MTISYRHAHLHTKSLNIEIWYNICTTISNICVFVARGLCERLCVFGLCAYTQVSGIIIISGITQCRLIPGLACLQSLVAYIHSEKR